MRFSLDKHVLSGARFVESPNQSERPPGITIDLLVIHNISLPPGEFGSQCVQDFFCNELDCSIHPFFSEIEDLKVSSHLFIDRRGSVTQFVPFDRKAWHAGESNFAGRENCNEFSIGIELEGTDNDEFTPDQYQSLVEVTRLLLQAYPQLTTDRIVGHSDIAPGRKTDPGPCFNWEFYQSALTDKQI